MLDAPHNPWAVSAQPRTALARWQDGQLQDGLTAN